MSGKYKIEPARRLGELLAVRVEGGTSKTLAEIAARMTLAGRPTRKHDVARSALRIGVRALVHRLDREAKRHGDAR